MNKKIALILIGILSFSCPILGMEPERPENHQPMIFFADGSKKPISEYDCDFSDRGAIQFSHDRKLFILSQIIMSFSPGYGTKFCAVRNTVQKNPLYVVCESPFTHTYFSPDDQFIFMSDPDAHLLFIRDTKTGELIYRLENCWYIQHSPSGNYFLTTSKDGKLCIWNAHTYKKVQNIDGGNGIKYSPCGKYFSTISVDRRGINIWEETYAEKPYKQLRKIDAKDIGEDINSLEFIDETKILIRSSGSENISIWNFKTGKRIPFKTEKVD